MEGELNSMHVLMHWLLASQLKINLASICSIGDLNYNLGRFPRLFGSEHYICIYICVCVNVKEDSSHDLSYPLFMDILQRISIGISHWLSNG